jgi:LmbE family N-acetylglucosaminyl deacetylase
MKFLGFNKVLCLSPHPDDVEYSMGGTILSHYDTQFDILCLTQGGDCDITTDSNRLNETKRSWNSTKTTNIDLHFTPYKFLKDLGEDEWINYIETNFINKNDYDCIFTTSMEDSHFEHKIISSFGFPLTRIKSISLIEYCSPSTLEKWTPNIFVDISKVYKTKLEMLKKFTSQQHRSYFERETINGFHTNFQCSKKGIKIIEQFNLKQKFIR